jgi:hypothetical protein
MTHSEVCVLCPCPPAQIPLLRESDERDLAGQGISVQHLLYSKNPPNQTQGLPPLPEPCLQGESSALQTGSQSFQLCRRVPRAGGWHEEARSS